MSLFVSFEGIDGSGKTTLSNLVCARLRAAGRRVCHARENGTLSSAVARRVREITRDPALLEMSARTELFLNLAREGQQLDEVVRPALVRGEICIADRSLHSLVALAVAGRGLPGDEVRAAVAFAAQAAWPDAVVLVDAEPELARLRKRVGKLLDGRERDAESRKGLAGAGLQRRMREHLLAEAAAAPDRWLVVENAGEPLDALADTIAEDVLARADGRPRRTRPPAAGRRARRAPRSVTFGSLEERFLAELDALAAREPALCAYLLDGVPGSEAHARRVRLAARAPGVVARSLRGLSDEASHALLRELAARCPDEAATGLGFDSGVQAMALRAALLDRAPEPVLRGLARNATDAAWALRERGLQRGLLAAVLSGLGGIDDPRAWALREEGARRGLWDALCRSLEGVLDPRAETLRAEAAGHDRLAAVRSTAGLDSPFARALRERLFPHAPKRVLRSLSGVDAPYAWALRELALPSTKEPLDSVDGMDHARAWELRDRGAEVWPATALSSLEDLVLGPRGRALVDRVVAAAPGRIAVLRNAYAAWARALAAARARPEPARAGGVA